MAHNWIKDDEGNIDFWAMNDFGSRHHGPHCKLCDVRFCIECNPELLQSDCFWFRGKAPAGAGGN